MFDGVGISKLRQCECAARPKDETVATAFQLDRKGNRIDASRALAAEQAGRDAALVADIARAISRGQPYDMLPDTSYEQWKDVLVRIRVERRN